MCWGGRSFAGPVMFNNLTRTRHIAECRSDVADDKIYEIPPRLIDQLGLKRPPIPIEFGKNYFRPRCCYNIDIIGEECGLRRRWSLAGFLEASPQGHPAQPAPLPLHHWQQSTEDHFQPRPPALEPLRRAHLRRRFDARRQSVRRSRGGFSQQSQALNMHMPRIFHPERTSRGHIFPLAQDGTFRPLGLRRFR